MTVLWDESNDSGPSGTRPTASSSGRPEAPSYTPGPWEYDPVGPEDNDVWAKGDPEKDTADVFVAEASSFANARLIAAAPELLKALTELYMHCHEPGLLEMAYAVIAKATGDTS